MNPAYERLPNETPKAYHSFAVYRDMGPTRSIQKVGKRLMKNPVALGRLSKKYEWVKRAEAYDLYMDREKMKAWERVALERERKHFESVELFEELGKDALHYLKKLLKVKYSRIQAMELIISFMPSYAKAFKEMIDIGRNTQTLERERAESLIRQDDARDVQQGREISPPDEKLGIEPIEEKALEPQNVLSFTGVARNGEKEGEVKEVPPKGTETQCRQRLVPKTVEEGLKGLIGRIFVLFRG